MKTSIKKGSFDKLIKDLIDSKKLDWVNDNISSKNFPEQPIRSSDYKLFHFDKYISSEDAVKEMEAEGYSPANIFELLGWKDWNEKDWVVGLGSVCEVRGHRFVPSLRRGASGRHLGLGFWDDGWGGRFRFLACKLSSGTKSLEPIDSLNLGRLDDLEKRVSILEKRDTCKTEETIYTKNNETKCPHCREPLQIIKG